MPRLHDRNVIRRRLEHDRIWAAYALGDLAPGFFPYTEWYAPGGFPDTLALLYRGADTPVLLTCGSPEGLAEVIHELPPEPRLLLSVRPEALLLVRQRWAVTASNAMWRMGLPPGTEVPSPRIETRRLDGSALPALLELFADGRPTAEEPDFFAPAMLQDGTYFGVWQNGRLAAAAGTHLVAPSEGVAAIGNVYTRRDCRGRGLGRAVVAAVTRELQVRGLDPIILNVRQSNAPALHLYESLGFRRYCPFYEGIAQLPPFNSRPGERTPWGLDPEGG